MNTGAPAYTHLSGLVPPGVGSLLCVHTDGWPREPRVFILIHIDIFVSNSEKL